jgi:hypothetical protein
MEPARSALSCRPPEGRPSPPDAVKTHLRALFRRIALDGLPRARKRAALIERAFQTGTVAAADFER